MVTRPLAFALCWFALAACESRDADRRFEIGRAPLTVALASGVTITGTDFRTRPRDGGVSLYASSPSLSLTLEAPQAGEARFVIENLSPGSRIRPAPLFRQGLGPTTLEVSFAVPEGTTQVEIETGGVGPLRLGVLSDVHANMTTFATFANRMRDYRPDFVLGMGDMTNEGFQRELQVLSAHFADVEAPFYTTIGNHDVMDTAVDLFGAQIGPTSVGFRARGVAIVLVDSASGTVAPGSLGWISEKLARSSGPAIVLTHMPPTEPWGFRNHAFSSREDAERFLQVLSEGGTDHLFVGHIHAFTQYTQRGIPTTISGTAGGGIEWPSDDRHRYLEVVVDPASPFPVQITRKDLD